jgi:hypothetical protein
MTSNNFQVITLNNISLAMQREWNGKKHPIKIIFDEKKSLDYDRYGWPPGRHA